MKPFIKAIHQANLDYHLLEPNDHIVLGFSGGVDSMALLVGLKEYLTTFANNIKISIVYMDLGFKDMDSTFISNWVKQQGYQLIIIPTQVDDILQQHKTNAGLYACSICSRLKKGIIVQQAKKLQATKVAFAHHGDDAIETFFLNMVYGGKLATFLPSMLLTRENITFIRPLVYVRKKMIQQLAQNGQWPVLASTCPNNQATKRETIKSHIAALEALTPEASQNLLTMLYNQKQLVTWKPLKKAK